MKSIAGIIMLFVGIGVLLNYTSEGGAGPLLLALMLILCLMGLNFIISDLVE